CSWSSAGPMSLGRDLVSASSARSSTVSASGIGETRRQECTSSAVPTHCWTAPRPGFQPPATGLRAGCDSPSFFLPKFLS
ncbi:feline sarcoma oncogene, isoform CRA_f, partial [Mus musculus]